MKRFCNNSWQWVVQALGSNEEFGLKSIEVDERRKAYGDNKINLPKGNGILKCIIKEFLRLYIGVLLLSVIYLFLNNNIKVSIYILVSGIITLSLKIRMTYKREKRILSLQNINYATIRVVRDGVEQVVKAEELVLGDLVVFSKGTLIPADLRIIECRNLKVDEKNLTGEEFLKEKQESKIHGNINSLNDMKNILFKGSQIKGGEGLAIVVNIGNSTELGKMLTVLNYGNEKKNILIPQIEKKLGRRMIFLTLLSISLYLILFNVDYGNNVLALSFVIISGMPIVLMILAYIKLIKNKIGGQVEIINPSVLKLINDVEIIFIDKVGSFSKEEMVVKSLGTNFIEFTENEADYNKDINIKRLIDVLLICNNSLYNVNDNSGKGTLDEIAFIRFGAFRGAYKSIVDNKNKKLFEIPMDSDKRILTTLTKSRKGCRANARGNVDEILDRCKYIMINGIERDITQEDVERVKAMDYNMSIKGLTTQGIAYRSFSYEPSLGENIESNLVFVGLVSLETPPVEDFKEKIDFLRLNNIVPILFTDANKITATTFGMELGLINNSSEVISGVEIDNLTREELFGVLGKVKIFSRIGMESKSKIVALFAKDNYNLLTTGDSIGDLPSLSLSTIGVAKGDAPQVIKNVSEVYIKNDYLNGVFKLVEAGKNFNKNIEALFNYFTMIALVQMLVVYLFPLYGEGNGISLLGVFLLNIIIGLPSGMLILLGKGITLSLKDCMKSAPIIIASALFSGYISVDNDNFYTLITLGSTLIIWGVINNLIKSKLHILLLGTIITIWIGAISLILSKGIVFSLVGVISIVFIIGIFSLIEWIIKKWIEI